MNVCCYSNGSFYMKGLRLRFFFHLHGLSPISGLQHYFLRISFEFETLFVDCATQRRDLKTFVSHKMVQFSCSCNRLHRLRFIRVIKRR